jgi:hypothetical protein
MAASDRRVDAPPAGVAGIEPLNVKATGAPIRRPFVRSRRAAPTVSLTRPVAFGLLGAGALLALYLGLITLAQGWSHATAQLGIDRWYVAAIVTGFGTQIALFSYLRGLHAHVAAGGMAASTGASTTAMLACCAHHVSDILPVLGLSGAALFLNDYKAELLWLGIAMNAAGIGYLVYQILKQRRALCRVTAPAR